MRSFLIGFVLLATASCAAVERSRADTPRPDVAAQLGIGWACTDMSCRLMQGETWHHECYFSGAQGANAAEVIQKMNSGSCISD